ncbi:hypothetical protein BDE02_10G145500 [Populus trichocarpa]|nr:hypothetical protein BDE02_10G145500 [Populus trichocarpa]
MLITLSRVITPAEIERNLLSSVFFFAALFSFTKREYANQFFYVAAEMPFCCFPFCCGKKSKSRHQKTVHPIYSTHPVDPGTKNTHVERGYGVEGGQIPEPIIPPLPVNSQADKNIGCSN